MAYGYDQQGTNQYQRPGMPQGQPQSPYGGGSPAPVSRPFAPQRPQFQPQRPAYQPAGTRPPGSQPYPPQRPTTAPPPPGYRPPGMLPPGGGGVPLPPSLNRPGGVPSPVFNRPTSTFGHDQQLGGGPPAGGDTMVNFPPANPGQVNRYNQLSAIDPNVLWAAQFNTEHGLNTPGQPMFGQDEVGWLRNLLPPRLMQQVQAGTMSMGGALNRYLQFLRGAGAGGGL